MREEAGETRKGRNQENVSIMLEQGKKNEE